MGSGYAAISRFLTTIFTSLLPMPTDSFLIPVVIPLGDIGEIRRTQHAFINPAVTIILRMGVGGHGVPPLGSPDGRVRYKFASFWNRNHMVRALQHSVNNFREMLEAEKKACYSDLRFFFSLIFLVVCVLFIYLLIYYYLL
ncbi:BAG-associated GRAM protein 1-like isoform X1 [Cucumis melo]|uniref:BAG-associated GRAM protein 1-like isoform X1 n=1 Tax=Cucumis melo TaxID=3656 RepID=A0A1S4E5P1_CUCME|nr:BAG-associated GRAM protein 1-like isoform X1 [Cucumis melo]